MKGFQLFFEAFKHQLQNKLDAVVALAHFMLIHECDFVCVGVGDQFTEADGTAGDEMLPAGWNASNTVYSLKYRARETGLKVLLKGIVIGNVFIVTAAPLDSSDTVLSANVNADQFITDNFKGNYAEAFVSGNEAPLEGLLRKDVIAKLREPSAKANEQPAQSGKSILLEQAVPPRGIGPDAQRNPYHNPEVGGGFPRIGGGDLDPLNRGYGGGMLYDPFSRNQPGRPNPNYPNMPPGAIPPGARFDPFGPVPPRGGRMFGDPSPDHFAPPGGRDPFI